MFRVILLLFNFIWYCIHFNTTTEKTHTHKFNSANIRSHCSRNIITIIILVWICALIIQFRISNCIFAILMKFAPNEHFFHKAFWRNSFLLWLFWSNAEHSRLDCVNIFIVYWVFTKINHFSTSSPKFFNHIINKTNMYVSICVHRINKEPNMAV